MYGLIRTTDIKFQRGSLSTLHAHLTNGCGSGLVPSFLRRASTFLRQSRFASAIMSGMSEVEGDLVDITSGLHMTRLCDGDDIKAEHYSCR